MQSASAIFQIACDFDIGPATEKDYDYLFRCKYNLESAVGISSFALSHPEDQFSLVIYTDQSPLWNHIIIPSLLDRLGSIRDISVVDVASLGFQQTTEHPLLRKCRLLHSIFTYANDAKLPSSAYLDGDHISLKPWYNQVTRVLASQEYELAMAHECGLTGIEPLPNYNSGLIQFYPSNDIVTMAQSWLKYSEDYCMHNEATFNDQHTLVYALAEHKTRILTLPEVVNLRCHPAYESSAHVWSDVYAVHNHEAAMVMVSALKFALKAGRDPVNLITKSHNILNSHFNPIRMSHMPRCVRLSRADALSMVGLVMES